MLNLKIIIGSTRPGRAADRVLSWITSALPAHVEFDIDVVWGTALRQARSRGALTPAMVRLIAAQEAAQK